MREWEREIETLVERNRKTKKKRYMHTSIYGEILRAIEGEREREREIERYRSNYIYVQTDKDQERET